MPPPPQIPGLRDLHLIGEGGFARVYRAREEAFDRQVAVKVLNSAIADTEALVRFQRECRALGQVDGHPNIVTVHSAGTTVNGHPYLIMAYEPNGSLQDRLDKGLRPEPQQLAKIGAELADALATAHAADVLHRDVKPANVLLSSREVPKLADFGIARLVGDSSRTKSGSITASIAHAPPEQVEGLPAGPASDAYSLGSTLAALALGHAPFMTSENDSLASVLGRLVTQDPPDLRTAGQSAEMASLVSELMRKDAADRPNDLAAVATRLRRMAEATPASHATDPEVNFAPVPPNLQGYPHSSPAPSVPSAVLAAGTGLPVDQTVPSQPFSNQPVPSQHGYQGEPPFPGGAVAPAGYGSAPAKKRRTGLLVGGVLGALALLVGGGLAVSALRDQPVDVQADVSITRPVLATASAATPTPTPPDGGSNQQQPLIPSTPRPTPTTDPVPTTAPTDPGPSIFSDPGLLSTALIGQNDLPAGDWTLNFEAQAASPADPQHPVALWDVCDQSLDPAQYGAAATNTFVQAGDPAIPIASTLVEVRLEPATVIEDIAAHFNECTTYQDSQDDGTDLEINVIAVSEADFEPYGGVVVLQEAPELGITFFSNFVVTDDAVIVIEADNRISVDDITQLLAIVALNLTTLDLGPGQ